LTVVPFAFGQAAELRIDHVTVAGARLDSMRQAFSDAVGISPGGKLVSAISVK